MFTKLSTSSPLVACCTLTLVDMINFRVVTNTPAPSSHICLGIWATHQNHYFDWWVTWHNLHSGPVARITISTCTKWVRYTTLSDCSNGKRQRHTWTSWLHYIIPHCSLIRCRRSSIVNVNFWQTRKHLHVMKFSFHENFISCNFHCLTVQAIFPSIVLLKVCLNHNIILTHLISDVLLKICLDITILIVTSIS